jgi:hypothetical protein
MRGRVSLGMGGGRGLHLHITLWRNLNKAIWEKSNLCINRKKNGQSWAKKFESLKQVNFAEQNRSPFSLHVICIHMPIVLYPHPSSPTCWRSLLRRPVSAAEDKLARL